MFLLTILGINIEGASKPAAGTIYKIDVRAIFYNRISLYLEQLPPNTNTNRDDSMYRAKKDSLWKIVLKNSKNQKIDSIFINLLKKDSWEKSLSNRKATIYFKYSENIKKNRTPL